MACLPSTRMISLSTTCSVEILRNSFFYRWIKRRHREVKQAFSGDSVSKAQVKFKIGCWTPKVYVFLGHRVSSGHGPSKQPLAWEEADMSHQRKSLSPHCEEKGHPVGLSSFPTPR